MFEQFEQMVVISLARRPDRRAAFFAQPECPQTIEIFTALDGLDGAERPDQWEAPVEGVFSTTAYAAWGCYQSHLQVLAQAVAQGRHSILVFEDDAHFVDNFRTRLTELLADLPTDWEALMLGGQHLTRPTPVRPGLVRCTNTHRTHAYGLRGPVIADLAAHWRQVNTGQIDAAMGPFLGSRRTYAPDPFLVGQAAGYSDMMAKHEPLRFWSTS